MDVLVVGGGPAGAVAATLLARAGVRVRVLDRARFPRPKLCGDSVNPGAVAVLERLGLGAAMSGGLPIGGMLITSPRVAVDCPYGGAFGYSITRTALDQALLAAAADAGAEIEEGVLVEGAVFDGRRVSGVRVKQHGREQTMEARLVIAADGRHSRVARGLGLSGAARSPRRWAVGAYYASVEGLAARGEMHIRRNHYIGVAPVPGGLCNACVVTSERRALADPGALLNYVLRHDVQLAHRFRSAQRISRPVSLGPLAVESRAAGIPGLLLAGDAAGFIDPMTGDGLRLAFSGAELAAGCALGALEHGVWSAHGRLAEARRAAFAAKWRFNRVLRTLVSSAPAVTAAGLGASLAPGLLREVVRYAGDVRRAA